MCVDALRTRAITRSSSCVTARFIHQQQQRQRSSSQPIWNNPNVCTHLFILNIYIHLHICIYCITYESSARARAPLNTEMNMSDGRTRRFPNQFTLPLLPSPNDERRLSADTCQKVVSSAVGFVSELRRVREHSDTRTQMCTLLNPPTCVIAACAIVSNIYMYVYVFSWGETRREPLKCRSVTFGFTFRECISTLIRARYSRADKPISHPRIVRLSTASHFRCLHKSAPDWL